MHICEWCNRISGDVIEGLCPTCYNNKHKVLKEKICQWCFEEPSIEGHSVCQECLDWFKHVDEENEFDLDKWLEEEDNDKRRIY